MRQIHAALHRRVPAAEIREALDELKDAGLAAGRIVPARPPGGRRREVWWLTRTDLQAVAEAKQALANERFYRRKPGPAPKWKPPTMAQLRSAGWMPPEGGRKLRRRKKPVPAATAREICSWIAEGKFLRDYCRRPGTPALRTVYAWTEKDPAFRRSFQQARELGAWWILDDMQDRLDRFLRAVGCCTRAERRRFNRQHIRPLELKLQRWRRHAGRSRSAERSAPACRV